MAKPKTIFTCQNCGAQFPKWSGQCSECSEWNTMEESVVAPLGKKNKSVVAISTGSLVSFEKVQNHKLEYQRISSHVGEFDRVVGSSETDGQKSSGLVKGSVILLGGEPGIGKSTLVTQILSNILIHEWNNEQTFENKKSEVNLDSRGKIYYVCGEESPHQIASRIDRLIKKYSIDNKIRGKKGEKRLPEEVIRQSLVFITTTNVDEICSILNKEQVFLLIVDSIQSITTNDLTGAAGSLGQVRESAQRISEAVKRLHIPTLLIGHVTKEGTIAGPKALEHLVDAVLEMSGERSGQFRVLRAVKNRFGATDEVGLFTMTDEGLQEVSNPSELFMSQSGGAVAGSAIGCVMEGTRPLFVEIQALVIRSQLAMPRRVVQGIPVSRLQVLCAVLQKQLKIPLDQYDVFVNVVGGLTIKEPSVDLAVVSALISSFKEKPVFERLVCLGEVGLLGEVRQVPFLDKRIKEAKRLGFSHIVSSQQIRDLQVLPNYIFAKK